MADRYTGIEQEFILERMDTGEDITAQLGNLAEINYGIGFSNELRNSIGQGPTLQEAVDMAAEISVSVDCEPPTLKATQAVGEYTEDSGAGTWTVNLTDKLPEMRAQIQVTETKVLVVEGIKFDGFTLTINVDGVVELTLDEGNNGNATSVQLENTTISTPEPDGKPESFLDVTALLDNETVGSADSVTINYTRNVESRRGIQEYTGGERRLPDEITEGSKNFEWDTTIEVTDDQAFTVLFNDDTYPLTISDFSDTVSFEAELSSTSGSIELTGGKPSDLGGQLINDDDVRTIDLTGNGTTATITGDL